MLDNRTMMLDDLKHQLDQSSHVERILLEVLTSLESKGYNPVNQVVGYLISGDPAYISSHDGARGKIQQVERDEIIEVLMTRFIEHTK
ncbi:MAG: IreB family regulatory phosphoprotein [Turicibacter sp.]|nr:IreB family regulatory phosphoprotein [Turicibacter sp.]